MSFGTGWGGVAHCGTGLDAFAHCCGTLWHTAVAQRAGWGEVRMGGRLPIVVFTFHLI